MRIRLAAALFFCFAFLPAYARSGQQREFLTPDEIDQVREAQEPPDRMKLYVLFARTRLERIEKEMGKASKDRGGMVHDLLYDYDRLIDAIDDLAALAKTKTVLSMRKGLDAAVRAEPEFLKRLKDLQDKNPTDLEEYRYILQQAIDSTQDSYDDLKEQLAKLPADKKEDKKLEKEAQQEEKERRKNEEAKKKK